MKGISDFKTRGLGGRIQDTKVIMQGKSEGLVKEEVQGQWYLPGLDGLQNSTGNCVKNAESTMTPGGPGLKMLCLPRDRGAGENIKTPVTAARIKALIGKQGFRCALTGVPLTPDIANLDHIVPIKAGGEHCMENVQVLHREVNRMKGSLPQEEFLEWCRLLASVND